VLISARRPLPSFDLQRVCTREHATQPALKRFAEAGADAIRMYFTLYDRKN
jgi:hypothetical protein